MPHKMELCSGTAAVLSRWLLPAVPRRHAACPPRGSHRASLQASAPPTPPLRRFINLAGEELEIVLLPTVEVSLFHEVKKMERFFVRAAPFSGPFFLHPLIKQSVALSRPHLRHQPARSWFPLKTTPTGEGWRLGCFVNKATDG